MSVRVDAQVVLDGLREVAPQDRVGVLEDRFEQPNRERDRGQEQQLVPDLDDPEPGQERRFLLDDHVDGRTDQDRRTQVEDLVEYGADGREPHPALMRRGVAEKAAEGAGVGRRHGAWSEGRQRSG